MKVEKIAHVHIVVKDIEAAAKRFSDIMGTKFVGPIKGVTPMLAAFDNMGLELQQPTGDGYIAKLLEERGEGVTAIGLKVPDIEEAIAELEAKGITFIGRGAKGDLKFAVTDPKHTYGVSFELLEYRSVQDAPLALLGKLGDLASI